MLTPATSLIQGSPILNPARSSGAAAAAAEGSPPPVNPTNGRSNDRLNLSETSQNRNPYQGVAPGFSSVKVDRWGQGNNDSVVQILLNQGYSQQEIYRKSGNGKSLLDEVTRVNGLRNANLIRAGQELMVPSKEAAPTEPAPQPPVENRQPEAPRVETPRTEAPRSETPRVETPPTRTEAPQTPNQGEQNEARVNDVRVDRWGQGPNSSLGAILKNQGFDDRQIFREDANGDSLLKKVARANGLESPDRIMAGSTLRVPNSMEALGQMNVPDMPARNEVPATPPAREEAPPQRTETAPPVRTETPPPARTETPPPARTETPPPARTEPPARVEAPRRPEAGGESEPTANMGMLLDGIKDGKFTRQEYQYLNARSSRYAQMRARFAKDGYSNDELTQLGQMERRYGVEFARLAASDDVQLPEFPQNSTNTDLAIQIKHYHESGPIFDGYSNGSISSETAIQRMVRQRDEARRQEAQ